MKDTNIEKYLLRKAFDCENVLGWSALLPKEILWRTKEAFSDGVSARKEAWFTVVQNYAQEKYKDLGLDGPASEKYLYSEIFNKYYPKCEHIVPYMWMPKFVLATDASARTLDIYKTINSE
jgi:asparagine synthase (glutamine-hydrolysing)